MSKVLSILSAFILCFIIVETIAAQEISADIDLSSKNNEIQISGLFTSEQGDKKSLLFENVEIRQLTAYDNKGKELKLRKIPGLGYVAETEIYSWKYNATLPKLNDELSMSSSSWYQNKNGALRLGHILPFRSGIRLSKQAEISIKHYDLGKIHSGELDANGKIISNDRNKSMVWFGNDWRVLNSEPKVIVMGDWRFSDDQLGNAANEIYEYYKKQFGEFSTRPIIAFSKFPNISHDGRWSANTFPASVAIVSADMPFETQSVQRMYEQLRHEILHLWFPNQLVLSGNYDWFYEGFTVYHALKTGVRLKQIKFSDMVKALSDAYRAVKDKRRDSLLRSSVNSKRDDSIFYAEAIIIAFLIDIEMLENTRGKMSTQTILIELIKDHNISKDVAEAESVILRLLKNSNVSEELINKYITGNAPFELSKEFESAGFKFDETLTVKSKLQARQKVILDRLGYNVR